MPIQNKHKDPLYLDICDNLAAQTEQGLKKILSVHFPGTGGSAEAGFPTKNAFDKLSDYSLPLIKFSGVGSGENAPVHRDTTSLAHKEKAEKTIGEQLRTLFTSPVSTSTSDPEEINKGFNETLALTETGGNLGGITTGAGENENNEIILNTLESLEQDGLFPDEIVLTGHSRGAINAIYLANEIYAKYGDKIKIHLVLTDPVPGPFHEMEWKKRVIPPSVATFTAFYAEKHNHIFFQPHDLARLTFTSEDTVITSYSTIDDHISITGNSKVERACVDVIAGIYGLNINSNAIYREDLELNRQWYEALQGKGDAEQTEFILQHFSRPIERRRQEIRENLTEQIRIEIASAQEDATNLGAQTALEEKIAEKLKQSETKIAKKVASEIAELEELLITTYKGKALNYPARETSTMHSQDIFWRKNCEYVAKTSLEKLADRPQLQQNLQKIRNDFDSHPHTLKAPPHVHDERAAQKLATPKQRLSYLHAQHRKGGYYNITSNEFAAYLLILLTLGFSATIYKTMEAYDNKFLILLLGVLTLNLATSLMLAAQTTYKIGANLATGGFFSPGYKIESANNENVERERDLDVDGLGLA
ncbi:MULTISPECIES: hypothetical protein [Legionella]|uniref:Uncharacterized protein n=1 Tax=Legionella septentrionalis TaxID=2498109 RepID=A0A3S0X243_9GAMM|nr:MULTISPECIES: hypothetical protein [Legionella]MCP0913111.1 hypothetical protein [Legionella sp. 27cVA30]RUQ91561.1 hypothetical protein EKM59_00430 [Legionella septentrionalis]RUQ94694.1 hypothetical protein ELY11_10530 [Legionella septentrionalis]RUR10611.1 hypothetical protein ELY14_04660 [Legionella septentrionalis]RUR17160.1 hypothetical protein ELY10_02090 [Legionella septentrionalis]